MSTVTILILAASTWAAGIVIVLPITAYLVRRYFGLDPDNYIGPDLAASLAIAIGIAWPITLPAVLLVSIMMMLADVGSRAAIKSLSKKK